MSHSAGLLQFSFSSRRLPIILQSELAECGAACLAMIASYHGRKMGIEAIRRFLPGSLKGISLRQLMQAASKINLNPRALRLDMDQLAHLKCPAILHWNLDHFVVLSSVRGNRAVIHDPANGRRYVSMDDLSQHFTGVALELLPANEFERKSEIHKVGISKLLKSATGLKRGLLQILILSLVLQVFVLLTPMFMQITVDHVVLSADVNLLLVLALGFGMLALIQMATAALRSWVILYLNSTLDVQLLGNTLKHLLKLPLDYFQKRHLGDIISRFDSLRNVIKLFTEGLIVSIVDGLMAITTLVMMYIYSAKLALIVVIAVSLYVVFRIISFRLNEQYKKEAIIMAAKENSNFMETVRGVQTIKLYSKEEQRESMWLNQYANALNAKIKLEKLRIIFDAVNQTLFPVAVVIIVLIAAQDIMSNLFTVGMLFAFMAYYNQFKEKTSNLIDMIIEFKLAGVDLERVTDIVHAKPEESGSDFLDANTELKGEIAVKHLAYRYAESEPYIFEKLNFKISSGETVVIIGGSGCGKTTLLKIMLGLLEPSDGEVQYDGMNLSHFNKTYLRSQIASVMQEDCLVAGSIAENIAFSDPQINFQQVQIAAEMAAVHNDIIKMPMAYNSLVGDMGTTLSGGQKQRIFLARALYRNPKILFLDEASSHLDAETEKQINHTISALPITRVIIAHRQETIKLADRVIDLSDQQFLPASVS